MKFLSLPEKMIKEAATMKRTLKEIYKAIEEAFYEPVDKDLIKKSEHSLKAAGLPPSSSERHQILSSLAEKELEKELENHLNSSKKPSVELLKNLDCLLRVNSLYAEAEEIKKENKEKQARDNLQADMQQAIEKKLKQLEIYYLEKTKRILEEIAEYLRAQQQKREEEEREKLLRAVLAAVDELFDELAQSTATSIVTFANGKKVEIRHADISQLAAYRKVHDDYFTGKINEATYMTQKQEVISNYLQSVAKQYNTYVPLAQAVLLGNALYSEMQEANTFQGVMKAKKEMERSNKQVEYTALKAVDTSFRTEDTSFRAEETSVKAENTSKESVSENRTATSLDEKETSALESESQTTVEKIDRVVKADEKINDCLAKLRTPGSVVDVSKLQTVINTVKPVVEIQHQVEEQKNQSQEVKVDSPKPSSFRRGAM
jgi:hypothetical protein